MRITNVDPAPDFLRISKTVDAEGMIEIVVTKKRFILPAADTILSQEIESVPDPGEPCGLVSIDATNQGGITTYVYTFRTVQDDSAPSQVTNATVKHLDGSTKTAPITMHEDFDPMFNQYGKSMKNGKAEWLEKNPTASSGLSSGGSQSINPLYGIDTYQKAGSVYSFSKRYRERGAVDVVLSDLVGKIVNPEGLDSAIYGEWIGFSVAIRPHGSGYIVEKKYLRDERGWLPELYG
jgi:hypothetical protein